MLSNEEKKAIEQFKNFVFTYQDVIEDEYSDYEEKECAKEYQEVSEKIINLIEKQQKEIEELKSQIDEHVYYDLGGRSCGKTELLRHYKKGYDMNNKFWKDKIKAKIEEKFLEAKGLYERGVQPQAQYTMKLLRDLEKSLLEKE